MSVLRTVMQTVARITPDKAPDPLRHARAAVGQPLDRVDGPLKVTGGAQFTAEFVLDNLAHASLVCSTIAKGRATKIDAEAAHAAPGVIAVLTHENAPRMRQPSIMDPNSPRAFAASDLATLQDERVYWNGQPIAVVVAETLEQAEHAASLVRVDYDEETPCVSFEDEQARAVAPADIIGEPAELTLGDAAAALDQADVSVDHTYHTPYYNHNAIEPHATIAAWNEDGSLTVFDATQNVTGYPYSLGQVFGLKPDQIQVIALFVGGGFGGKAGLWNNTLLCVAAAKLVQRPVKLVLSREEVYRVVGGRTIAEQRVALGARHDGHLTALIQTATTMTTTHGRYAEQCTFPARHLYASDTLLVGQKIVNLDLVANTWMRAPGESIGTFALESAIDELAHALRIDPIALRRINEPETDPTVGTPFSHRQLNEAYRRGAEHFGWQAGPRQPGAQRDGGWRVGRGVATAYYPTMRLAAAARVRISADGSALVQAAANEMGMGTATAQIQHAAERLGLPLEKVSFGYGDSRLPESPMAGGSCQLVSIGAAIQAAVEKAHRELLALARADPASPLAGAKFADVEARDGGLFRSGEAGTGASYASILRQAGRDHLEAEASSPMPLEGLKYSMASYGAQFCEVRVNEDSGEVRVSRWLGSFDCGRVINPKTTISQLRGGIIMGIGMALTEETLYDDRRGRIMNPSLAEYHVPVNLDVPHIDIIYNDIPDAHTPLGAHGVGEIGITGAAAAIANAIFDATGRRLRRLPITLDALL